MAATALADVSSKDDTNTPAGSFKRKASVFRHQITTEGDSETFVAEPGRYLLYVSYACPWACRCLAVRALKGLEDVIDVAVVAPSWTQTKPGADDHRGWTFDATYDGATADPIFGVRTIREVYEQATKGTDLIVERFTVPILFDKKTMTIVNNESSEILRFFNSDFNAFARNPAVDMFPLAHCVAIDAMNESIYESVNNGVYKCGFAQSQGAYDIAVVALFKRLDELDELLATQRFLVRGAGLTEADIRLFVTLIRFDVVYYVHFKCSWKLIRDYVHLSGWLRDVYQTAGGCLAATVNLRHIQHHYFGSHETLNPYGIIPHVQDPDVTSAHGRASLPV